MECSTIMSVYLTIMRIVNTMCLVIDLMLYTTKIYYFIRKKSRVYVNNLICFIITWCSLDLNIVFVMTELINKSWSNINTLSSIVGLALTMGVLHLLVTIWLYWAVIYDIVIFDDHFVIHRPFFKTRNIDHKDIDTKNSRYYFIQHSSRGIFKNSTMLNFDERLELRLNNGEIIKINLNPFIISGAEVVLFITLVKKLKIAREKITK